MTIFFFFLLGHLNSKWPFVPHLLHWTLSIVGQFFVWWSGLRQRKQHLVGGAPKGSAVAFAGSGFIFVSSFAGDLGSLGPCSALTAGDTRVSGVNSLLRNWDLGCAVGSTSFPSSAQFSRFSSTTATFCFFRQTLFFLSSSFPPSSWEHWRSKKSWPNVPSSIMICIFLSLYKTTTVLSRMWRIKHMFKLILFLWAQVNNTGKEPAVRQATSGGMCAVLYYSWWAVAQRVQV